MTVVTTGLGFFLSGCGEDFTTGKSWCIPESLSLLRLCAIRRHLPPFFRVDYATHRDRYTERISKINPAFLFPPGCYSFSPSFHYILYFASIMGRYKLMAGSRAAQ